MGKYSKQITVLENKLAFAEERVACLEKFLFCGPHVEKQKRSQESTTNIIHLPISNFRPQFGIDFQKGKAWCDGSTRKFWGFDDPAEGSDFVDFYFDVVPRVIPQEAQIFIDTNMTEKKHKLITKPYKLVNGNTVIDELAWRFHGEDYEFSSVLEMQGHRRYFQIAS